MALGGSDSGPDKRTGFTFKGQEIVLSKTRGRPLINQHWKKGFYTEKKRIEAATLYAALGSVRKVSDLIEVPQATVRSWRSQQWFRDLLDEIRAENNDAIDVKFSEIIDSALDQLKDRVVNGDHVLTKEGDLVRKPVGARDLSLVTAINWDKRQLARGLPTSRTEQIQNKSVESRLIELKEAFEKQTGQKIRKPEIIDADVIQEE